MINAVMFDFWNTLIVGRVTQAALKRADRIAHNYLKKQGYKISYEDYRKRKSEAFNNYQKLAAKGVHLKPDDILKRFIFYDLVVKPIDFKKIAYINDVYDREIKFRKGCKTVLKELKNKGYKIALVSNSWLSRGKHCLEKKKLHKYFDAMVLSSDVGVAKPDKRIFELAAKKLKVLPFECVFVGDEHKSDIQGAYDAGICYTIAIEPFKKNAGLVPPTAIIRNLQEILQIIEKLN